MRKSTAIIKTDAAENWEKAKNYVPDSFTIIVYEFDNASPKIKIGDGIHKLSDIPFLIQEKQVIESTLIL